MLTRQDLLLGAQLLNKINPELAAKFEAEAGSDQDLWVVDWEVSARRSGSYGGRFVVDATGRDLLTWCQENKIKAYLGEVLGKHSEVVLRMDSQMRLTPITDNQRTGIGEVSGWTYLDGEEFIGDFIEKVVENIYQNKVLQQAVDDLDYNDRPAVVAFIKANYLSNLPNWHDSL